MAPIKTRVRAAAFKLLAFGIVFAVSAVALWVFTRPSVWAGQAWGTWGYLIPFPFVIAILYYIDGRLDKVLKRQAQRRASLERLQTSDFDLELTARDEGRSKA